LERISLKKIRVDGEKCAGCRVCEMVCSFHHEKKFNPQLSRVRVIKDDKYGLDYPVFCHQCESCPSLSVCSFGALNRSENGVIQVDDEKCTGCGVCVDSCLFQAIHFDDRSNLLICDLCGGKPSCVDKCPTTALRYIEGGKDEHPEMVFKKILSRWAINE
jgi:Fe-S-cluster-containing hydrogenase component 2